MTTFRVQRTSLTLALLMLTTVGAHAQIQVINSLMTSFAGLATGCAGQTDSLGDGCPAADSAVHNPTGVAVDSNGNLYIADENDEVIRKVNAATGVITTVAGNGMGGFSGDNGSATSAELNAPESVAVDAAGDLFIVDLLNVRIREVVAATGKIITVAGNGSSGYSGDNNPATGAEFRSPGGIAVNPAGTVIYIGDSGNNVVRMVNLTTGIITTYAGNGTGAGAHSGGYSGDNGPAVSAEMFSPAGVALDANGDLYIADTYNSAIRKVTAATGKISTVAGTGSPNYKGDGGLATAATLYFPLGVTVDSFGNLFIADSYNCLIREVNSSTGQISTIAGNPQSAGEGVGSFSGDNGPPTLANLNIPQSVAIDSTGNVFIADTLNNRIRKVSAPNSPQNFPATAVGGGATTQNLQLYFDAYYTAQPGQPPTEVPITLSSIGISPSVGGVPEFTLGAISGCVADGTTPINAGTICTVPITFKPGFPGLQGAPLELQTNAGPFFIGLNGIGMGPQPALLPGLITTVAGTGATGYTGDNGPAINATFNSVFDVALDYAGNMYIDDYGNDVFRKVTAATGIVTTFAGNGTEGYAGDNFLATTAELQIPWASSTDSAGNVYIADTNNNAVREVNATNGIITTLAGDCCSAQGPGFQGYNGDGIPAATAELFFPQGVVTDIEGNLYIADLGNNRIREVTAATGTITTFAGTGFGSGAKGVGGYTGDEGPATAAELNGPYSIAIDSESNVYIADFYNNVIRKVTAATGIITTVAGVGTHGETGDNGPATSAELASPIGIAVDAAGNLYIAESPGNIRKVDAATGTITTIAGGGNGCAGQTDSLGDGCGATSASLNTQNLGLDPIGNLYIADNSNNRVRKVSLATAPIDFPQTPVGSSTAALTFKVANIGNAPLNLTAISPSANFTLDSGTTTCSASEPVPAGGSCVIGVAFSPTKGGATSGTLTLTDNALNASGATQVVTLNGSVAATSAPATPAVTVTPNPSSISTAQALSVTVTVSGGSGNPTPTGSVTLTSGAYSSGAITLSNGSATINIPAGTLATGADTLTASYAPDAASASLYTSGTGSNTETVTQAVTGPITASPVNVNFGTVPVGSTSATVSVTMTFTGTVTLSKIAALAQGVANLDFAIQASGTTCALGDQGAGSSCAVALTFSPLYPGPRNGALVLYDNSSPANAVATVYLTGIGQGPLFAIVPGVMTTVAGNGGATSGGDNGPAISASLVPTFMALDGAGDIFVEDSSSSSALIRRIDATSGVITTIAGGGGGCANQTDSLGDGCKATQASFGIDASPGQAQVFYNDNVVILDGAGNLYTTDLLPSASAPSGYTWIIRKIDAATGVVSNVTPTGSSIPFCTGGGGLNPSLSNGTCFLEIAAVDGTGTLYLNQIDSTGKTNLLALSTQSAALATLVSNYADPCSGTVDCTGGGSIDGLGNLFMAGHEGNVLKIALSTGTLTAWSGPSLACDDDYVGPVLRMDAAGDGYFAPAASLGSLTEQVVCEAGPAAQAPVYYAGTDNYPWAFNGDNIQATQANLENIGDIELDGKGNLYVSDAGNSRIRKDTVGTGTPIVFPSAAEGATSAPINVTIQNIGNAALSLSSIVVSPQFTINNSGTTCAAQGQIAPGTTCVLAITFAPTTTGAVTGTITFGDNSLNTASTAQILLSGTATGGSASAPTVTVTPNPATITTAQALSVTVTVGGTPTPTGSVALTSGSYSSGAVTLSAGTATINVAAGSLAIGADTLTVTYTPDSNSSSTYTSATGSNTVTVAAANVQVTVGTGPAGLSFTVDDTSYSSTQTLTWIVGASHTIATTTPQVLAGTQESFSAWSDGGAQSHTVTATSTTTTYTASFTATAYQLTTAASPAADGTVIPATGTFYAPGTVVSLTATPNSGFSFTNWTGSVASANSAATTITMSAPENVTANFGTVAAAAPVAVLTPTTLTFSGVSGTTSAAQSATLTNSGNATLNITGITVTGTNAADFAIATGSNACGTTLAAGANCLIYITFTPASVATFSATLFVADNAAGSPQTATLSGTGAPAPTFTISTTTAPQTIQPGGSAQYTITATAQNGTFSSAVSLAASGLPTGAVATFSPASITPGSSTASSTLSIQTVSTTATAARRSSTWPFATSALAIIGLCLVPGRRRRRWITMALLLIASLGAFTALTACGGGFAYTAPSQSYSITVTGTAGTDVQTTTVQLTVQ